MRMKLPDAKVKEDEEKDLDKDELLIESTYSSRLFLGLGVSLRSTGSESDANDKKSDDFLPHFEIRAKNVTKLIKNLTKVGT
jgi:hypothetical protein